MMRKSQLKDVKADFFYVYVNCQMEFCHENETMRCWCQHNDLKKNLCV